MSRLSSHRSGVPLGGKQKKKIVMRGAGKPKREWTPGPLIKPLSKSDAIRRCLKQAGRALTIYELMEPMEKMLHQVVSRSRLYALLGMMQTAGEIVPSGRGEKRRYGLRVSA